ncbi:hypothetical protein [Rhodococcus gannanensis]|uniref:XRE family transcriptional regulator n=1 Tax=Rhodococcus gannanensis TaxID=1960308 RepID=A0ABW4NXI1_9NOCA
MTDPSNNGDLPLGGGFERGPVGPRAARSAGVLAAEAEKARIRSVRQALGAS